jgi:hypothetical protein
MALNEILTMQKIPKATTSFILHIYMKLRRLALVSLLIPATAIVAQEAPPAPEAGHEGDPAAATPSEGAGTAAAQRVTEYLARGSELRARDVAPVKLEDAQTAVHLFQLGPDAENIFPEFKMMTGDRCEKERPLEFAVRWERNTETNKLEIAQSTMLVSPSYEFKSRRTEDNDEFLSLPDLLVGELSPNMLEAGKFSATYAPAKFRQLIASGRVKVEPLPLSDQNNRHLLKFKITTRTANGGERSEIKTVNLNANATLSIRDPDSGASLSATLMPYSVHFAARSQPLFESERWQMHQATGTALHAADWEHVTCRWTGNPGSAGCARLQTDFASSTYQRMADRLSSFGGVMAESGTMGIAERDVRDASGRLTAQRVVETPQNAGNIDAFLKLRKETQIKAFMPASVNSILAHYDNKATEYWQELHKQFEEDPASLGEFGQRLGQMRATHYRIQEAIAEYDHLRNNLPSNNFLGRRDSAIARARRLSAEVQQLRASSRGNDQAFIDRMNQVAKDHGREALPGALQNFYVLMKKNQSLSEQASASGARAGEALYEPNTEEYGMYYKPENASRLWDTLADSIERYYSNRFGENVPAACKAFVRKYRKTAADIRSGAIRPAVRARPVSEERPVLRALPVVE